MKKINNEKIKEIYVAYMKAFDDIIEIETLIKNCITLYPQYADKIMAFNKLSHKANKFRALFPKPKVWYERDLYLRVSLVNEALCYYYLQKEKEIEEDLDLDTDFWERFLSQVKTTIHKEIRSYLSTIKNKKNPLWGNYIYLNILLSPDEEEGFSKYYSYIVVHGPYRKDVDNRRWVELAMLQEYNWAQENVLASKETYLRHIKTMEKILSVQRSLQRRTTNKKNEDTSCNLMELEMIWILQGMALCADLRNKQVQYLYDIWKIGKKQQAVRDCIIDNIAHLLLEIPPEKLDSTHAKKGTKLMKELLKVIKFSKRNIEYETYQNN